MSKLYRCQLHHTTREQFSDLLDREAGCICPDEQPDDPSEIIVDSDCPLHELEKMQLN